MKQFLNFLFLTIFSITTFGQNLKISELTSLTNAGVATNDVFPIVDTSANQTKKFSIGEFDLRYAFTVNSPLSKTAGASPVVSIPLATSSVDGYLSSSNWTTFNNKVSLSGTEALTNKDYDGGTASNTSRITLPKAAKSTLDALTRKQGTLVYDTTSNKPYYDNGSILTVVGSGSGGGKNFVDGGDAESGTTGWATFKDAAATSPADGTGGSPTIVSWSTTATAPLESLNSFTYTKTGSNAQGEGVAYTFSLDPAYRAKVISISFDYILSSGTFVPGTSSDVSVWLYDVTNSQLIQPSSFNLLSNSTTNADKFQSTFQTSATGASYRLILFSGTTSASAYTLKIDNVSVAPTVYSFGTPITDWQAVTMTGTWVSNTTYTAKKRRIGDSYEYDVQLALTGAPTSATLTLNLPSGDVIDTAKLASGTNTAFNSSLNGRVNIIRASAYTGGVNYTSTTSVSLSWFDTNGNGNNVTQASPGTFANGDFVGIVFRVPIVGLSSSVQMSDQTSTRIVSFRAYKSGGNNNGSSGVISYTSVEDTHGGFSLSAGTYTVQVPGDYQCGMNNEWASVQTASFVFKAQGGNKGTYSSSVSNLYTANSHLLRNLVAGDTIYIAASTGSNLTLVDLWFYCTRQAGPNQIAASEKINFSYGSTNTQSISAGTPTIFIPQTKNYDSHGLFNTSTGQWSFPRAGKARVTARVLTQSINPLTTNHYGELELVKNGSVIKIICGGYNVANGATTYSVCPGGVGSSDFSFLATDVFSVKIYYGMAFTVFSDVTQNYIDVEVFE